MADVTSFEEAEVSMLMAKYGITRVVVDQFHFRGWRYATLRDAIAQAKKYPGPPPSNDG